MLTNADSVLLEARFHFYSLWADEKLSSPFAAPTVKPQRQARHLKNWYPIKQRSEKSLAFVWTQVEIGEKDIR
ncbi:MAG: hypothetical protein IPN15_12755 [Saprospiraceae bacterium]|nr:hypothetical protein [Candidatus Vicinibacter affinis]